MDPTKILVVDPDEANRQFLAQMLQKKNYNVFHAANGNEGIHQATDISPDMIISGRISVARRIPSFPLAAWKTL